MKKIILVIAIMLVSVAVNAQIREKNSVDLIKSTSEKLAFYKKCNMISPEKFSYVASTSITGVMTVYDYFITDTTITMSYKKISGNQTVTKILVVFSEKYMEIAEGNITGVEDHIANMYRMFKIYLNVTEYKKLKQ